VSLRQRKEVQKMSRSSSLVSRPSRDRKGAVRIIVIAAILSSALCAQSPNDKALWDEYGLAHAESSQVGNLAVTTYRMKDLTGALAAWEWLRSGGARSCDFTPFCSTDGKRTVLADENYVVLFEGGMPNKEQAANQLTALPNKSGTSLPAILTFIPRQGLIPGSAKYILGPVSLAAFAPELASLKPGFEQGAEAQVAQYAGGARLALFYYPSPEMARLHAIEFKLLQNVRAKRSDVLIAAVYGGATEAQAQTLLSRVQYEAKITWNEVPPPSPIKPLYSLLVNIMYMSIALSALCLMAGLIYAGMRLYRRRYGTLDSDEAMTTLHLTGD
jgi:hypothetical protein